MRDVRVYLTCQAFCTHLPHSKFHSYPQEHQPYLSSMGAEMVLALQYIEEPLKDSSLLRDLQRQTGQPVAVDESLDQIFTDFKSTQERTDKLIALLSNDCVSAAILKPSVLGGLVSCMALARLACRHLAKVCAVDS